MHSNSNITSSELSLAFTRLAHDFRGDVRREFGKNVRRLIDAESYKSWLADEANYAEPAKVPPGALVPWFEAALDDANLLESLALADRRALRVKFHRHLDRLFCTDGLWIPRNERVFPFTDESQHLANYVQAAGLDMWASYLLDPATGAGHHPLALNNVETRIGMDLNPRALTYAGLNSHLNDDYGVAWVLNDINHGVPHALRPKDQNALFLANMPFAISPGDPYPGAGGLALTSEGGVAEASLTFRAIKAFGTLAGSCRTNSFRGVFLTYTLAAPQLGKYQTPDWAKAKFPDGKVTWQEVEAPLWRVNGRKEQSNPMPLENMQVRINDEQFADDAKRLERISDWRGFAKKLKEDGWTHLSYGILDIKP